MPDAYTVAWTRRFGDAITGPPAIAGDRVYVPTLFGETLALDAATGKTVWTHQGDLTIDPGLAAADGVVYVGNDDSTLYALDAETGHERWTFTTRGGEQTGLFEPRMAGLRESGARGKRVYSPFHREGQVKTTPTVVDGVVYVGSDDGSVYAVADGEERWRFETGDRVWGAVTVREGLAFVGSTDGNVYALDASDGTEAWAYPTDDGVYAAPVVADGRVFVGSSDRTLYALDAETGHERWTFEGGASKPAVVGGDILYAPTHPGRISAIAVDDGTEHWHADVSPRGGSPPLLDEGVLHVPSKEGYVAALDAATGDRRFTVDADDYVDALALAGDTLYVGDGEGRFQTIRLR